MKEFQQFVKQFEENLNYLKQLMPDYQNRIQILENPFKILYDYFVDHTSNLVLFNFHDLVDRELEHFFMNMKILEYLIEECKHEKDIIFLNGVKQHLTKYINFNFRYIN